jgi:hypothetical protein
MGHYYLEGTHLNITSLQEAEFSLELAPSVASQQKDMM